MEKVFIVGLGGTGSRIVGHAARELEKMQGGFPKDRVTCVALDMDMQDLYRFQEDNENVHCVDLGSETFVRDCVQSIAGGDGSWVPDFPAWEGATRMSGCAGQRWKGRLAFLEAWRNGKLRDCEKQLAGLLRPECHRVKVLLATSLAGGFGAGVFLQTALWIRQFFERNAGIDATVEGYFLLPDVYAQCYELLRANPQQLHRMYAGAYAAISEWNAITKIRTGAWTPSRPVKLDGLFHSESEQHGVPVFTNSYLIGACTENDGMLSKLCEYEEVAGRCLAIRALGLSALESQLDGVLLSKQGEPVFASCGTAKAVYPTRDVLRYCALRSTQDHLEESRRLHRTVEEYAAQTGKKDRRKAFVEGVDKLLSFDAEDASLRWLIPEVREERKKLDDRGKVLTWYVDKVETYLAAVEKCVADMTDDCTAELPDPEGLRFPESEDTEDWCCFVETMDARYETLFAKMEASLADVLRSLMRHVAPETPELALRWDPLTLDRLFEKTGVDGVPVPVHPLAAKYLLYRLVMALEKYQSEWDPDARRRQAYGFMHTAFFDNPATTRMEAGPVEYLRSKGLLQSRKKFFERFRQMYTDACVGRINAYREFLCNCLKQRFADALSRKLEGIVAAMDGLFDLLSETAEAAAQLIDENIQNTQNTANVVYVCASASEKEEIYRMTGFDLRRNAGEISGVLLRGLQERNGQDRYARNERETRHFRGQTMPACIVSRLEDRLLREDKENIRMDIGTAVRRSSDIRMQAALETESQIDRDRRHNAALRELAEYLCRISAPMLKMKRDEAEDDASYTVTVSALHPTVVQRNPAIMAIYGNQRMLEQQEIFGIDEWLCYTGLQNLDIGTVAQFDGREENSCCQAYRRVIEHMIGENSTADTPHLDKTWHTFLLPLAPETEK